MNNPLYRSEYIEKNFKEYLKSSLVIEDNELDHQLKNQLSSREIFKGPYLSFDLPFKPSLSIGHLVDQGYLESEFIKLGGIPKDRILYVHQFKAIKRLNEQRSIVISTGTGSGKTESFIYPIINDILKDFANDRITSGIKAIFLYPVNALVNDQMDRLRDYLRDYPEITFGAYTGDTPESNKDVAIEDRKNKREAKAMGYKIIDHPENEIRSREDMRKKTPMLLFTNYAMLEYILIRPEDNQIFTEGNMRDWKFIVLDEAHRYTGALGIELSHLLRRLSGKFKERQLQYVLTSATLGNGTESLPEIIKFASNLTDTEYDSEDIIFAERIEYSQSPQYALSNEEILVLNSSDDENKEKIFERYGILGNAPFEEKIFDLLYNDDIFSWLISMTKIDNVRYFPNLYKECESYFNITKQAFIDYIDLISMAEKNDMSLLKCKYHTFVRTPQGAYARIKPDKDLSLNKIKEKNGIKYFELGTCRFCSSAFYIGHIFNNKMFIQNDQTDIYENYGEESDVDYLTKKVDFLLINKSDYVPINEDINEYRLCQKCGNMYKPNNINAQKCDCGSEYELVAYHVISKSEDMVNNLRKCPVCEASHPSGIISAFHIRKDEATALLSQINLRSMNKNGDESEESNHKKQFIAFSDAVQQASFFAVFLEQNHLRFLRKRLILKVLEDENDSINFKALTGEIEDYLSRTDLVEAVKDRDTIIKTAAHVTTLSELLNVDGQFSGEGLGLFAFRIKDLNARNIQRELENNHYPSFREFSTREIINLAHVALDLFRVVPAIYYNKYELDTGILYDELLYRSFQNAVEKVSTEKKDKYNSTRSFLPSATNKKPRHNKLTKFISKVIKSEVLDECISVANDIWKLALNLHVLEPAKTRADDKQINISKYRVIPGKDVEWYMCNKCHRITPNNVKNVCPQYGCDGTLDIYIENDKVISRGDFYKKQYRTKPLERLRVEEHTAQIGKKIGRVTQDLFKNKDINVLSSSTTFEMGIDIGSLDDVFMRNVPPTPANYAQRAGRAGRRKGNAAFVMTYCDMSSHDFSYFNQPKEMIKGTIRPPYFNIRNKKIILRHIIASAFGFFFADKKFYFKKIGEFIYNQGVEEFKKYIRSKPSNLGDYVDQAILHKLELKEFEKFGWIEKVLDEDSSLNRMEVYIKSEIQNLKEEKKKAEARGTSEASSLAHSLQFQIERIENESLINALSKYIVIPKYGFPVDVVELEINDINGPKFRTKSDDFKPSRDLSIAISEYAPESEIVIDKKKYKSRYIKFPREAFDKLESKYYYECSKCHQIITSYSIDDETFKHCPHCGTARVANVNRYIIPSYGFKTDFKEEKSKTLKPKKTYAGEINYIGDGISNHDKRILSHMISIESSKDDELMSFNKSPFYVCKSCGYTKIIKKHGLPEYTFQHKNAQSFDCSNKRLTKIHLAHKFKTDVVKIKLNFSMTKEESFSTLYALLDALSYNFNIERRDINGLVHHRSEFILFDQVAGGAGHVKRLLEQNNLFFVIQKALKIVNQDCCDEDTSCYSCLRNYQNQRVHEYLKKSQAKIVLERLYRSIESYKPKEDINSVDKKYIKTITIKDYGIELTNYPSDYIAEYIFEDYDFSNDSSIKKLSAFVASRKSKNAKVFYNTAIEVNNIEHRIDLFFPESKELVMDDSLLEPSDYSGDFKVVYLSTFIGGN